MKQRPILVICIDRDNDLYEKAKVSGPLVGRERNLQGAMALSLADPEDPDSNAIYYAVKTFDKMRADGESVEIVTLTGDRSLGYKADKEISNQLDKIIAEMHPSSCMLISDGASDEEILPIIKSRIKVDSTKIVFIKQAKELEKTYFVLLEKLRDPYFAKFAIGIPAALILLLSLSSYLGWGWQPVGIIIGIYLVLRTLGADDFIGDIITDFRFSFERSSWIGYVGAVAIFSIALFVAYQTTQKSIALKLTPEKMIAYVIGSIVWIVFMGLMFILIGKSIDALSEKKKFRVSKYLLYGAAATLTAFVIFISSIWVVNISPPYVDFGTFLLCLALSLALGYYSTEFVNWYRKEVLSEMKIEGKEAISEHGTYLGKVVGLDSRKGNLIIQTMFDKRYTMSISAISAIDEKVVMKASE